MFKFSEIGKYQQTARNMELEEFSIYNAKRSLRMSRISIWLSIAALIVSVISFLK